MSKKNRIQERQQPSVQQRQQGGVPQRQQGSVTVAQVFSGPLPDPVTLERYDDLLPGLADRIVSMAESQSVHRQHLERTVVEGRVRAAKGGQWMAFSLGAIALVGGFVLIGMDKNTEGVTSIISAVGALVGVFLWGRHAEKKEREAKQRDALPPRPSNPPEE